MGAVMLKATAKAKVRLLLKVRDRVTVRVTDKVYYRDYTLAHRGLLVKCLFLQSDVNITRRVGRCVRFGLG